MSKHQEQIIKAALDGDVLAVQCVVEQLKILTVQRDMAVEALRETTAALEHRWEVIANRAAPVMESVIDAAHSRGIRTLAKIKEGK